LALSRQFRFYLSRRTFAGQHETQNASLDFNRFSLDMPMPQNISALKPVLEGQPVIPVVLIENAAHAVPMAQALVAGGLPAIEITLRTGAALEAIRRIAGEVEGAIIGAGTILDPQTFEQAVTAGARFIVSPGLTRDLVAVANDHAVPLLPGAVTPSEMMEARAAGYTYLKFFPAEQAGGAGYLNAISSPLKGLMFCPTGGITKDSAANYLNLPNVVCVGGSWITPRALMAEGKFADIEILARAASQITA
jgi:2-dehydro-3-deoxyphosphogluconate aldolase / (4S)-4-hydroxy-2-oxoglutarate aldolase